MKKIDHSLQAPSPLFDALKYIKLQSQIENDKFKFLENCQDDVCPVSGITIDK